jgi:DNA-binding response OmpR family regulator
MAEPAADAGPVSVLLAEHEPEVAEMSARYLRREGMRVRLVTMPELALAALTGGPEAAAVLDLTMPGLDPRRIRRALRTPVIFLVAGPRPRGLALRPGRAGTGPRRWLARPFSPRQLVARVRDVLAEDERAEKALAGATGGAARGLADQSAGPGLADRSAGPGLADRSAGPGLADRSAGPGLADRSAGPLTLDGRSRTMVAQGEPVKLTATEFAVLAVMMDHPGRVLSRRQLLAAAGHEAAGDRAADVYIAQLRAKIGPDPKTGVIRTVRGAGYQLSVSAPACRPVVETDRQ